MNDAKVVVVTGGSRGIGKAIATAAARDGHYVVINYRSDRLSAERFGGVTGLWRAAGGSR